MWLSITTAFLVAGTIIGVIIALVQLNGISETSKADFMLKFKDSFFKKEARELMNQIDRDSLKFVLTKDSISEFMITRHDSQVVVSAYDVDQYLLDQFDALGLYERKGIVSLDMVYNIFDWYIEECWEDPEISKYVQFERREYGPDQYRNFEYIYYKCHAIYRENKDMQNGVYNPRGR